MIQKAAPDEPLTGLQTCIVGLAMLLALVVVARLRAAGMQATSTWGFDSQIYGTSFHLQLGVLLVGAMATQLAPEGVAKWLLVVEGAACLFLLGLHTALFDVALLILFYGLVSSPLPPLAKVVGAGLIFVVLGIVGSKLDNTRSYAFCMFFAMRLIVLVWESWRDGFPKIEPRRFLVYLLAAPLIVFPPYLMFIPRFTKHESAIATRFTKRRVFRAFRHLGTALVLTAILTATSRVHVGSADDLPWQIFNYVVTVAQVAQVAHVTFALLLLHGMDDRLPIDKPLLSTNFLEYWNRFEIHQKDFQVDIFYTPALLYLRKKNRYVAIVLALVWTLVVWNTIYHVILRYLYFAPGLMLPSVRSALLINAYNTVAIGGTLCLHEWRRRKKIRAPESFAWNGACWALTMVAAARTS